MTTTIMESAFALINLLILMAVIFGIPILIGVYVYRDARNRGMNAALWTLIAVLAPALVGFIIYLIVRSSYSELKCPQCETPVKEEYTACPKCGAKLRATCASCGFPMDADWSTCPKCTAPVTAVDTAVTPPIKKQDRMLSKILIAILLIPMMILFLLLFGVATFSTGGASASVGTSEWTTASYAYNPQVSAWIKECDRAPASDIIYVLRSQEQRGENYSARYLIYRPDATEVSDVNADVAMGVFRAKMKVKFTSTGGTQTEPSVTCISYTGTDPIKKLTFTVDGKKTQARVKTVDFNPALTNAI